MGDERDHFELELDFETGHNGEIDPTLLNPRDVIVSRTPRGTKREVVYKKSEGGITTLEPGEETMTIRCYRTEQRGMVYVMRENCTRRIVKRHHRLSRDEEKFLEGQWWTV